MKFSAARVKFPSLTNALLAVLSAVLLILAFPGFEFWFIAWFALVPLFYAIEKEKESIIKSLALGWMFGTLFFFGSCWWLTFSLINYGGIPTPIAYFLLLIACLIVGLFPAIFAALFSIILKRFGTSGIFAAPFLWIATEFFRFWGTGNNWNAFAYSQAFKINVVQFASIGGIYLVSFLIVLFGSLICFWVFNSKKYWLAAVVGLLFIVVTNVLKLPDDAKNNIQRSETTIIALQPNVPMSGLRIEDLERLRQRHVQLAEAALQKVQRTNNNQRIVVVFPESPMNFEYTRDLEFQKFLREFTAKNNVSVLFNAAEPTVSDGLYNSAVLVNEHGARAGQYDKIHLVPFGEYVPLPDFLAGVIPTMVGNFEIGKSYNLVPLADDLNAGIMICFESHFPTLSREFAREGADVLIEMTNDGYLGNTPVLRQHLANAVFRAVETNRPVVRVTNVGITAFIDEKGNVSDATEPYAEDVRIWIINKSDAPATFYVRYGDWFAWFCTILSLGLLMLSFRKTVKS